MRPGLALLAALAAACAEGGAPAAPAGRLVALVVRPVTDTTRDTVRFETEAVARRCATARGVLLDGVSGGNGVLLWLRPGDSATAGEYAYAARGDSIRDRTVVAAVRYVADDVSRGVVLDSGRVAVTERGGELVAGVRGSGLGMPGAVRVFVHADFAAVPVPTPRDTVPCEAEP